MRAHARWLVHDRHNVVFVKDIDVEGRVAERLESALRAALHRDAILADRDEHVNPALPAVDEDDALPHLFLGCRGARKAHRVQQHQQKREFDLRRRRPVQGRTVRGQFDVLGCAPVGDDTKSGLATIRPCGHVRAERRRRAGRGCAHKVALSAVLSLNHCDPPRAAGEDRDAWRLGGGGGDEPRRTRRDQRREKARSLRRPRHQNQAECALQRDRPKS
jgi:hypothetical protein